MRTCERKDINILQVSPVGPSAAACGVSKEMGDEREVVVNGYVDVEMRRRSAEARVVSRDWAIAPGSATLTQQRLRSLAGRPCTRPRSARWPERVDGGIPPVMSPAV